MKLPVRVLLLEMPTLVRGMLERAVETSQECELINVSPSSLEPLGGASLLPDVVILGLTAPDDAALLPAVFARWPEAQVMTVGLSEGSAVVYELQRRRSMINDASPDELVQRLNEAVRRGREFAAD